VAQGNAPEALSLYRRALEIRERLFGAHHPKTEETRQCVLLILQKLGRQEEAAPLQTTVSEPTRTEKELEQHSEQ
jgi:Tetratricopeptide repeat